MTRRLGRHWRRHLRGGRAVDVPRGRRGTLRGWSGGRWYGSVVRLGEQGLGWLVGWLVDWLIDKRK